MDRRIILPALFGILTIAAAAAYASVFLILPLPAAVKLVIAVLFTAIAAAMAYLIIQRTKELKEEDKDDIGKY
jgi:membrane protein implicated in regulation of membrane protease activity